MNEEQSMTPGGGPLLALGRWLACSCSYWPAWPLEGRWPNGTGPLEDGECPLARKEAFAAFELRNYSGCFVGGVLVIRRLHKPRSNGR